MFMVVKFVIKLKKKKVFIKKKNLYFYKREEKMNMDYQKLGHIKNLETVLIGLKKNL